MAKLIHNLTNSPNLVERIKGIDRDIDTLNAKVGSIPEGMDIGQSIIDLQDNKQDKLTAGEGISIENNVISNTQRPAEWGNITGDITDQVDLQNELSSISDSIPTKTSDLTNDSGFITNSVNDLVNYYLKSETYTQEEVNNLIGSIQSFHYEIYPTIGSITTPLSNVLYLIGPSGTGSDRYEEYVYSNNNFVKIGETSIDLSGYVTIDNLNNALSNYTTTANLTTLLAQKQDVLTAGAGISIINNVISNTIPGATISNTAPSNPTQGMLRYDTVNDALKSYDGSNWNEVGNESSDINTKAFYLSGTSDLTNAQAAYDWFSAGKNPIVMYNNRAYLLYAKNATQLIFQDIENSAHDQDSYTEYVGQKVIFTLSGNDVTAINYNSTSGWSGPILRTDVDYPTPYTPAYAGSPTTKQYVDNNDTYIGASAPTGNVVEGRLWYDTTNNVLKVYDGINWNEVGGDTYTAGTGINIDSNNEISVDTSVVATQTDLNSKQDTLTTGNGINIDSNNEISADTSVLATQTDLQNGLNEKQDKLTAGDNIQISNTNIISATDTTYNAGENITIEDICTTESDMKGPCPSRFHIPTNGEWQNVINIWKALGGGSSDGTNFGIALKLPFAGKRNADSTASIAEQGTNGYYRTPNIFGSGTNIELCISSSQIAVDNYQYQTRGHSVRAFKNSPVVPDATWTKLYGVSVASGGIFWSSADGLISLSSNGSTWITMQDKNLGATQVWNDGDTLSESNCGGYFQRGNNYMFPYTGNVTVRDMRYIPASDRIDVTGYGPGNYYYSSDFIDTNYVYWGTPEDPNLRGGQTQGTFQDCIYNVISAEGTTYTAGSGLNLSNGEFSVDTTTIATKADIANIGMFVVVASLPSVGTANTKTIYLLGPIGTGADKYEEWIVTEDSQQQKQWTKIGETSIDLSGYATTSDLNSGLATKQDTLTAGTGINIDANNVISNTQTSAEWGNIQGNIADQTDLQSALNNKQDKLTAGTNIQIDLNTNTISATDTKYTSGYGINIDSNNEISANTTVLATKTDLNNKQDTLVSGTNIKTINNNSLLGNGNITLNDVKSSATAPSSPIEGMLWYDTINDILKVYNGSSWVEAGNGKQGFFKTRSEYNELPDSKLTDGNTYFIIDRHSPLLEIEEMYDLYQDTGRNICIQELNIYPQEYYDKYNSEGYMNGKNLEYNGIRIAAWNSKSSLWNQPR